SHLEEAKSSRISAEGERPRRTQHETIRAGEPRRAGALDHVDNGCLSDDAAERKLVIGWNFDAEPALHPDADALALDLAAAARCVDQEDAASRRRPGPVLDVFHSVDDQMRPRLTDAQPSHVAIVA